jgi:hypothetical protein
MKTQAQAQKIFDVLISELELAPHHNLLYISKDYVEWNDSSALLTPLEDYLKSIRSKLTDEDFDEEFFKSVYAKAFYTGSIPKDRNHIVITCERQVESNPRSPVLKFWIDLDKVATQLNSHLQINPPYCFKVNYGASKLSSQMGSLAYKVTSAVNSVYNPSFAHDIFLFGGILTGYLSVMSFLIAALALFALMNLSTAGIVTAVGVGLLAGAACYGFFKAKDADRGKSISTTAVASIEPKPASIESIFEEHFTPEKIEASLK